ncbi:uncharacterized protein [Triticum aestivum]|uniref:uncharacterized protein isoform X3 n=1 Tax=Triticum aestivum TaxID=4565 RepID=UPI001D01ED51|nr:uncharacterized protein LOC123136682 isoform X3 [Triticum aestivum]
MSRKEYSWFLKTDYAPSSTTQQQTQDNSAENFKRANKVLASDSEPVHIWNFSGRTTFILMNEWNRMPQDPQPSDQEILDGFAFLCNMDYPGMEGRTPCYCHTMVRMVAGGW